MADHVVLRISGPRIEDAALHRQFSHDGYDSMGVYKVYGQRTTDTLVAVHAVPGLELIAIKLWGGPLLVLHPEHARDLLLSAQVPVRGNEGDVAVTSKLPWTCPRDVAREEGGASVSEATIDWIAILRARPEHLEAAGAEPALALAATFDAGRAPRLYAFSLLDPWGAHEGSTPAGPPVSVPEPDAGIPAFDPEPEAVSAAVDEPASGTLPQADPAPFASGASANSRQLLVFLHSTFATAEASFDKLCGASREHVERLLVQYGAANVLAFEHPTLMASPICNALDLARGLPDHAKLDLVTHGRGGLIAEIMVRAGCDDLGQEIDRFFPADTQGAERALLLELVTLLRSKSITVRRVVRVACPARGTLLASRRLDAWLSVLQWQARVSGIAVADQWLRLLCEIARTRPGLDRLGGLAAMLPDSALIRWLNAPAPKVDSELFVLAGESTGDGLQTWLQTLMADALFWTDSDLVVQTRSMYGGVPRASGPGGPKFLLVKGDRVTHFSYFEHHEMVEQLVDALVGKPDARWKGIGPVSWSGRDASGRRDKDRTPERSDAARPTVLLIPDLFGSVLTDAAGRKVWLNERSVGAFERLGVLPEDELDGATRIVPTRLLRGYYGDLHEHLARTHNVIDFPYDWRISFEALARRLDDRIGKLLQSAALGEQPLRIVAHGMGALLVRAWHARHRANWSRLMARAGTRVMLVGPPNAGTWLPLRLFSGDDSFGTLFSTAGPLGQELAIRRILAGMPGIVQLQAGLSDQADTMHERDAWERFEASEYGAARDADRWHGGPDGMRHLDRWAIPDAALLGAAREFWQGLERALPALLRDADRIVVVAGTAHATMTGLRSSDRDLHIVSTHDGDRQVTLDSAALPGVPLWPLALPHNALTCTAAVFDALADLLATGTTGWLKPLDWSSRGGGPTARRLEALRLPWHGGRVLSGRDVPDLMATAGAADEGPGRDRLLVRVHHGDLRFIRAPLLVGHYKSMTLTGAEAVIDALLGNRMAKALRAGVYPEREGSFQIFENGRHSNAGRRKQRYIPRPRAAVVVGLGEEGKLTAQVLSYTVRIGVLAYAERFAETRERVATLELAATLIGSGGTGVSVSAAALALVQGVADANMRLQEAGWPTVGTLSIVEVYLDRATDAWRVLRMQSETMPGLVVDERLVPGDGALRRPLDTSYRGATYDFISAVKSADSTDQHPRIAYSLDTRRARTEVRAQQAQGALVRDLVRRASNTTRPDKLIGRTLFNLLIPVEIEPYLAGSTDMLMELDGMTAALPWELLDTDPPRQTAGQAALMPWAIRSKVLRKLRTEGYRGQVRDSAIEDGMLIIGEPETTDPRYGALPGARAEARAIAEVARAAFGLQRDWVIELNDSPNATTIINALFARNYRIVHIAGHGSATDACGDGGGVVLSGDSTFLGANEIRAMRITPELVFLNCCHLAQSARQHYDRVHFAAGVATELINIGVRCVVVAGWAIEDKPAEVFARTFYGELFAGRRFIDAVGAARAAAWENQRECNTWAAYQCYGDPEWSWRAAGGMAVPPPAEEYAGVASPLTLMLVLQAITTELLYTTENSTARNRARLDYLQATFGDWKNKGDVAQEFGLAFAALPDRQAALAWYERAIKASDSAASLSAVEMYSEQLSLPGATDLELRDAIRRFEAIQLMHGRSLRRCSMCGNACRRLAMALRKPPLDEARRREAAAMLEAAREQYEAAAACEADTLYRYYPLRAALSCRLRAILIEELDGGPQAPGDRTHGTGNAFGDDAFERKLAQVLREIQQAVAKDPQFWTIVAQSEYEIIKGVARRNLTSRLPDIRGSLRDLHNRINTRRFWMYVYDDACAVLLPYIELIRQQDERQTAQALCRQLEYYSNGENEP